MASITTNKGRTLVANGSVDLLTDTLKVVLLNASYTPNKDHNFVSDINTYELSGTGYTGGFAGGGRKTLANKTVTQDDTNDWAKFDADDVSYTAINAGTAAYAAIVKEITNDAASPVIAVVDINPDIVTNGGDMTLTWGANGILTFAST
jgi:hypothetical protein